MPAKAKDENRRRKLLMKVFERIKESEWGTSSKSMWIKHPWNTSARTFESKNHIKIEITRYRVMENGCIWVINACWVSQWVFYQVLNPVWCVFKERRLKRWCYYMWNAWYKTIVKFTTEKICAHFYHPTVILWEGHKILPLPSYKSKPILTDV